MKQKKQKRIRRTEHRSWAWRYLCFESRLALWFIHALPRNHPERIEVAECLRKTLKPLREQRWANRGRRRRRR